jgi:hypothetical protein
MPRILGILAACAVLVLSALPAVAQNVEKAPPGGAYKKVSELVKLPDFLPGIGTLYVDPKTLPEGPFLAYDHAGKLVSTIYMFRSRISMHKRSGTSSLRRAVTSITSACTTTPAIRVCLTHTIT